MHFCSTPPPHCVTLHMSVFPCQQREHQGVLQAEEAAEKKGNEEHRMEEGGGGVFWWLWDTFLGSSPEVTMIESCRGRICHPFSLSVHPLFPLLLPLRDPCDPSSATHSVVGGVHHQIHLKLDLVQIELMKLLVYNLTFLTWVTLLSTSLLAMNSSALLPSPYSRFQLLVASNRSPILNTSLQSISMCSASTSLHICFWILLLFL